MCDFSFQFINISSLAKIILDIKFLLGYLLNFRFHMDYYRFSWILIKNSRRSSLLTEYVRFHSRFASKTDCNYSLNTLPPFTATIGYGSSFNYTSLLSEICTESWFSMHTRVKWHAGNARRAWAAGTPREEKVQKDKSVIRDRKECRV